MEETLNLLLKGREIQKEYSLKIVDIERRYHLETLGLKIIKGDLLKLEDIEDIFKGLKESLDYMGKEKNDLSEEQKEVILEAQRLAENIN